MIGSLRGELLDRTDAELLVEVGGLGYRVQVTPATVAEVGDPAARCSCTCTPPAGGRRDVVRLHLDRGASCLRDPDRHPRRRPVAGAGDPVGALAARAAPRARHRRRGGAVPGAGGRQEDRCPSAGRAEEPSGAARQRHHRGPDQERRHPEPPRPVPTCATRSAPWATARTRSAGRSPTCPTTAAAATCCAPPAATGGRLMARDELLDPSASDDELAVDPVRSVEGRRARVAGWRGSHDLAATPLPRGVRRPGRAEASAAGHPGRAARRRGPAAGPLPLRRPPGLGKTSLSVIVAAEMDVALHVTSGPALERPVTWRRSSPARRGRRALHRRDPPPVAFGRRGALTGDGGLPARHRAGQGPRGPLDPTGLPRFCMVGATTVPA